VFPVTVVSIAGNLFPVNVHNMIKDFIGNTTAHVNTSREVEK
jgi:hypothetical protein